MYLLHISQAEIHKSFIFATEGRRDGLYRPNIIMKKYRMLVLCLLFAAVMLLVGTAFADDPIVTSIEISPNKLSSPGTVTVTISISNSGDTDMKEPVYLYDPAATLVTSFGNGGSATLKAGETKTWTGEYEVNSRTLESGSIVYFIKYTVYNENGQAETKKDTIRGNISSETASTGIEVERVISSTVAKEGDNLTVTYSIKNTGNVSMTDVTIQENTDISKEKQTIPELPAGKTAKLEYKVTMGKANLTSGATITYNTEAASGLQTYTVENQTISYGNPSLSATLTASSMGVVENGTVTLTLTLKNTGTVAYTDIQVTDPALGDVFTNQELAAGKTLTLEKEVTVPSTMNFCFTVTASDDTGSSFTATTEEVTVTTISEDAALNMTVTLTSDKTEIYSTPGDARFTIIITNDSNVDATSVVVSHGDVKLYTFNTIKAGETQTLTRDFSLSMSGKYQISVTAVDPLQNHLTFTSNELRIVLSAPTAVPATPTPVPTATPEPTVPPTATMPSVDDPGIAPGAKALHGIMLPIAIISGVLLLAALGLVMVGSIRRSAQKKASEAAVDQLELSERRDYAAPSEHPEEAIAPAEMPVQPENMFVQYPQEEGSEYIPAQETDYTTELPHMKYVREAAARMEEVPQEATIAAQDYVAPVQPEATVQPTFPVNETVAEDETVDADSMKRRRRSEH